MRERLRQLATVWSQLREVDNRFQWWVLLGACVGVLLGVGLGLLSPFAPFVFAPLLGLLFGLVAALAVLNRRITKAQYRALDGRLGAAAAILDTLRGQWFLTPAVSVNAKQDLVHRVVGRCGVVLVGEGSPQRVKGLLAKERKRLSRVVGDVPVTTLVVGDGEGQVTLRKLQVTVTKLPRKLRKSEVPRLERKLKPLDRGMPLPKGIDPLAASNRKRPKPR